MAETSNPVPSAFMYKCLIHSMVTILIGLRPSNLSDIKMKSSLTLRYTPESFNDEGSFIVVRVIAYNVIHEKCTWCFAHAFSDLGCNRANITSKSCRHGGCLQCCFWSFRKYF